MVKTRHALLALLALALCLPAAAADYYFKVNELKAELTVRPDGLVDIRYAVTFSPQAGSHPVDIVDIGMPNEYYDIAHGEGFPGRQRVDRHPQVGIRQARRRGPSRRQHDPAGPDRDPGIRHPRREHGLSRQRRPPLRLPAVQDHLVRRQVRRGQRRPHRGPLQPAARHPARRGEIPRLRAPRIRAERIFLPGRPRRLSSGAGSTCRRRSPMPPERPSPGTWWPRSIPRPKRRFSWRCSPPFSPSSASSSPCRRIWIIVLIIIFAVRSGRKRMKQYLPPRIGIESGGIKRGLTPPEAAPAAGAAAAPGAAARRFRSAEKRRAVHQGDRGQGLPLRVPEKGGPGTPRNTKPPSSPPSTRRTAWTRRRCARCSPT